MVSIFVFVGSLLLVYRVIPHAASRELIVIQITEVTKSITGSNSRPSQHSVGAPCSK